MKLSEIKKELSQAQALSFQLQDGSYVPESFHVTEVGLITKHFIDCGGTVRSEKLVNFQLWNAEGDEQHRLHPEKLLKIIALSEKVIGAEDLEVEVEYQTNGTIGKYALSHDGKEFLLVNKQTACLAQDTCGRPAEKQKLALSELSAAACCTPGNGCC